MYAIRSYYDPGEHTAHEKPVFFTPAGNYRIFNGDLRYLVSTSKIFQYQGELEKEVVAVGKGAKSLKSSEIWFGLELNEDVEFS